MKKSAKCIALLLAVLLLAAALTACGGNTANTDGASGAAQTEASQEATAGETFDIGTFTVLVPNGWVAKDYKDMNQVKLYKTNSLDNIFGVPEIDITYNAGATYELVTAMFESYEEVEPITTGAYTWNGVQGKFSSTKDLLSLNTVVGDGYIAADVWVKVSEDTTISVNDADVNAILAGITIK
ncbi:MAG: hypothetical protein Q3977_00755 [Oscillospiraceae bacterium]|nr:hypothetical protein [Oscillospiraceae bacterium]